MKATPTVTAAQGRALKGLADRLDLSDEHVQAAFEDVCAPVAERRLPVNVDPFDSAARRRARARATKARVRPLSRFGRRLRVAD